MTNENARKLVEETLNIRDLTQLKNVIKGNAWIDQVKAFVNFVPFAGGFLAQEIQNFQTYNDSEFLRKYIHYIYELSDTTKDERYKFACDIADKADDYPGNVIANIVNRLDNINKERIFARLSIARMHNQISIDDFFRLSTMLERIPYVDLNVLYNYLNDYYDDSGDTELLFATGALMQSVIGADGDKYVLSKLGRMLLKYGLEMVVDTEQPVISKEINATNSIGWEEIGEITESPVDLDRAQSDYDVLRGK